MFSVVFFSFPLSQPLFVKKNAKKFLNERGEKEIEQNKFGGILDSEWNKD